MNKVSTYFRDSYKELLEKVTWPSWTQLQQSTMIVLAMDYAAGNVLKLVYNQLFK